MDNVDVITTNYIVQDYKTIRYKLTASS